MSTHKLNMKDTKKGGKERTGNGTSARQEVTVAVDSNDKK